MGKKNRQAYILPFRSLSEGTHKFDYELDSDFICSFETLSEYAGNLVAKVVLLKQDSKQKISINLEGTLETACDRCLESMEMPFEMEGAYYLREAEENEEEKEDVVFVKPENQNLELSTLFYELIMLGLPQQKMHEEGECDADMLEKLELLKVKEDKIDPRWAELEKLIKKDK